VTWLLLGAFVRHRTTMLDGVPVWRYGPRVSCSVVVAPTSCASKLMSELLMAA
jgi:hypothetical protein